MTVRDISEIMRMPRRQEIRLAVGAREASFLDHANRDFDLLNPEEIDDVPLAELRNALLRHCSSRGYALVGGWMEGFETDMAAMLMPHRDGPPPWLDSPTERIEFGDVDVVVFGTELRSLKRLDQALARHLTQDVAATYDAQVSALGSADDGTAARGPVDESRHWYINVIVPVTATFGDLVDMHYKMTQAVFRASHEITTPYQVLNAARLGHVEHLLGSRESEWLDAKGAPYDLKPGSDVWKIELARDVAGFANTEQGGLILIGVETRAVLGGDQLYKIHPIPQKAGRIRQYLEVLRRLLVPFVEGLIIEAASCDGGEVLCIYIPPQPRRLGPFIVDAGVVDDRHSGCMISIVRRLGEDNANLEARDIQKMLSVGRAVLEGTWGANTN